MEKFDQERREKLIKAGEMVHAAVERYPNKHQFIDELARIEHVLGVDLKSRTAQINAWFCEHAAKRFANMLFEKKKKVAARSAVMRRRLARH